MADIFGLDGKKIVLPRVKRNKRIHKSIKRLVSWNEEGRLGAIMTIVITKEGYPGYSFATTNGPVDSNQLLGAIELAKDVLLSEIRCPSPPDYDED